MLHYIDHVGKKIQIEPRISCSTGKVQFQVKHNGPPTAASNFARRMQEFGDDINVPFYQPISSRFIPNLAFATTPGQALGPEWVGNYPYREQDERSEGGPDNGYLNFEITANHPKVYKHENIESTHFDKFSGQDIHSYINTYAFSDEIFKLTYLKNCTGPYRLFGDFKKINIHILKEEEIKRTTGRILDSEISTPNIPYPMGYICSKQMFDNEDAINQHICDTQEVQKFHNLYELRTKDAWTQMGGMKNYNYDKNYCMGCLLNKASSQIYMATAINLVKNRFEYILITKDKIKQIKDICDQQLPIYGNYATFFNENSFTFRDGKMRFEESQNKIYGSTYFFNMETVMKFNILLQSRWINMSSTISYRAAFRKSYPINVMVMDRDGYRVRKANIKDCYIDKKYDKNYANSEFSGFDLNRYIEI